MDQFLKWTSLGLVLGPLLFNMLANNLEGILITFVDGRMMEKCKHVDCRD